MTTDPFSGSTGAGSFPKVEDLEDLLVLIKPTKLELVPDRFSKAVPKPLKERITADVVVFLYDESEYAPDKESDGTIEVIVKKNRKGPNETVKLAFNKRWSRFKTLPKGGSNADSGRATNADEPS